MSKGVLAIFSRSNAISLNSVHSFVNLYNMPFVSTSHPTYKNYKNLEPYNYEYKHEGTSSTNPDVSQDLSKKNDNDNNDDDDDDKDENDQFNTENHLSKHLEMINQAHLNKPTIVDDIITSEANNDASEVKSNFQLTIHPDMVPVLVSLIKYSRWKSIYYIYNHDEGKIFLVL